jgi:hypothetical protein
MSKETIKNWWTNLYPSTQIILMEKHQTDNIETIYNKEFNFNYSMEE